MTWRNILLGCIACSLVWAVIITHIMGSAAYWIFFSS